MRHLILLIALFTLNAHATMICDFQYSTGGKTVYQGTIDSESKKSAVTLNIDASNGYMIMTSMKYDFNESQSHGLEILNFHLEKEDATLAGVSQPLGSQEYVVLIKGSQENKYEAFSYPNKYVDDVLEMRCSLR